MKALLAINKAAMAFEKNDAGSDEPQHRMTFGIYYYAEPVMSGKSAGQKIEETSHTPDDHSQAG